MLKLIWLIRLKILKNLFRLFVSRELFHWNSSSDERRSVFSVFVTLDIFGMIPFAAPAIEIFGMDADVVVVVFDDSAMLSSVHTSP